MTEPNLALNPLNSRSFWIILLINALWINVSEVFRYFAFVMPMLRRSFPEIENIAPMDFAVFALWGLWDTILVVAVTGFVWIFLERFGRSLQNTVIAGTLVWLGIFGILWIGMFNMNLATLEILAVALPLSWLELVIAGLIVHYGMVRFARPSSPAAT